MTVSLLSLDIYFILVQITKLGKALTIDKVRVIQTRLHHAVLTTNNSEGIVSTAEGLLDEMIVTIGEIYADHSSRHAHVICIDTRSPSLDADQRFRYGIVILKSSLGLCRIIKGAENAQTVYTRAFHQMNGRLLGNIGDQQTAVRVLPRSITNEYGGRAAKLYVLGNDNRRIETINTCGQINDTARLARLIQHILDRRSGIGLDTVQIPDFGIVKIRSGLLIFAVPHRISGKIGILVVHDFAALGTNTALARQLDTGELENAAGRGVDDRLLVGLDLGLGDHGTRCGRESFDHDTVGGICHLDIIDQPPEILLGRLSCGHIDRRTARIETQIGQAFIIQLLNDQTYRVRLAEIAKSIRIGTRPAASRLDPILGRNGQIDRIAHLGRQIHLHARIERTDMDGFILEQLVSRGQSRADANTAIGIDHRDIAKRARAGSLAINGITVRERLLNALLGIIKGQTDHAAVAFHQDQRTRVSHL